MWRRWKRQSSGQGTRSASRAWALQPLSRPVRIWMTEPVCTSIMIGATSAVRMSSARTPRKVRPRRPRKSALRRKAAVPKSLGA